MAEDSYMKMVEEEAMSIFLKIKKISGTKGGKHFEWLSLAPEFIW